MQEYKKLRTNEGRRKFIKNTGATLAATAVGMNMAFGNEAVPGKDKILKVGLVGCGGRGTGAAVQALVADGQARLTAMGDIFEDHLQQSYSAIKEEMGDQVTVDDSHKFIGFDAYQKVIDSGVDVILLTTPPVFRPQHLDAAVDAGVHAFCEKPVAVDPAGVQQVLEASKKAKAKKLSIQSGFCYRFDAVNMAAYERIHQGAVGDIHCVTTKRFGGELWSKPRQPGWTDMEYQLRNWLYYDWLSGDFITEQAVHSLDLMAWALGDRIPVKAIGTGGRQKRVDPIYGNVYDHFAIEYEYEDGVKGIHMCRQQSGTKGSNTVDVFGSKGHAYVKPAAEARITGSTQWQFEGQRNNMYQHEHDLFFAAIRNKKPINDGVWMAHSSMLAILGRMVGYSGQEITWDQAMESNLHIGPRLEDYTFDYQWDMTPVPVPGETEVFKS